jgi:sugar lactone lactonase YvrE
MVLLLAPALASAKSKPKHKGKVTVALWVANGANVLEFTPGSLKKGVHDSKPHVTLNSTFGAPQGIVFDSLKNLWVIDGGTASTGGTVAPALDEFTSAQLGKIKKGKSITPTVQLTSTSFVFPQQAVFDSKGNLWVSDNGANEVFLFTPAQLTAGGAQTPAATITSTPTFTGPLGIALSSSGNLWVANNGTTTLFEFNAANLPSSGSVTLSPNVVLSDNGANSIQGPWALAFDANGNLWSSNANSPFTLVEFAATDLAITGSPTPAVTISPTSVKGNTTLAAPNGIAFDNLGDLAAVSSATPFGIADFLASQLTTSGTTTPNSLVVGAKTTLNAPAGCNFGPIINR